MSKLDRPTLVKLFLIVALSLYAATLEMDIQGSFTRPQTPSVTTVVQATEESVAFIEPSTETFAMASSNPDFNIEVQVLDAVTGSPISCAQMHLQDLEVPVGVRELVGYSANEQGVILADLEPGWYGTEFYCQNQDHPPFYPVYGFTGDIHIADNGEATYFVGGNDFKPNEAGVLVVEMEMVCWPPLNEATPGVEVELYGETCLHDPVD